MLSPIPILDLTSHQKSINVYKLRGEPMIRWYNCLFMIKQDDSNYIGLSSAFMNKNEISVGMLEPEKVYINFEHRFKPQNSLTQYTILFDIYPKIEGSAPPPLKQIGHLHHPLCLPLY